MTRVIMGLAKTTGSNPPFGIVLPPDVASDVVDKCNDIVMVAEAAPLEGGGIRILYVNPAFVRITGYTAEEVLGRSPRFLGGPETSLDEIARIEAAQRERRPVRAELLNYRKDGTTFWVEMEVSFMTSATTGAEMFLFIERDITEHKRLVKQVIQSQRLESIGTLAGGIAHDLNNILAPIMMAGDLLGDKVTDEEGAQLLKLVQGNSRRGAELVRQILMFARGLEGQRIAIQPQALLRDVFTFLEKALPKSIRLTMQIDPGARAILGDPAQLHQLLLNFCVNARDAMPAGGQLAITVSPFSVSPSGPRPHPEALPGDYTRIDVADEGTGIPDSLKGQIFDPFFTTKGSSRGSGLGLSTARSIAKSHAGFITFVSKEGSGSTFSTFLPAADLESQAAPGSNRAMTSLPKRGQGEHILVVDDEDSVRQIVAASLQHHGFQTTVVALGTDAVSAIAHQPGQFKVALIDTQMPGMDGPDTASAIHYMDPSIAMVGLSGTSTKENHTRMSAAGVRHFLDKPFTVDTLVATVHMALGAPKA